MAERRGKMGCYSRRSVSQEVAGHAEVDRVQVSKQGPATAARSQSTKHIQAPCPLQAITRSRYPDCATVFMLPADSSPGQSVASMAQAWGLGSGAHHPSILLPSLMRSLSRGGCAIPALPLPAQPWILHPDIPPMQHPCSFSPGHHPVSCPWGH